MLLTITTAHQPASDLGFLLHKHPDRCQSFDMSFGRIRVFYPEVGPERCSACLLLDVDPVGLARGKNANSFSLGQYVNDRPYAASSFMSVAIAQVFGSALQGRCKDRPELATMAMAGYQDIIKKLIAAGVPAEQIAAMGDADSDAKKQALFEKVRNGSVRVLLGSTQKMGTGTNRLVENVRAVWERTAATRGTQMIFADMGVNPTPWGYSPYEDITRKLVAHGIPREQIAAVGDAESDAKKQALFEKVRQGSVRVLIGSTQKMGTGTNVQKRLVALHHLDAPWKPAEVEQRDGRILRQGNTNKEVAIYRYVTEGSFDAYMWVRREVARLIVWLGRKT